MFVPTCIDFDKVKKKIKSIRPLLNNSLQIWATVLSIEKFNLIISSSFYLLMDSEIFFLKLSILTYTQVSCRHRLSVTDDINSSIEWKNENPIDPICKTYVIQSSCIHLKLKTIPRRELSVGTVKCFTLFRNAISLLFSKFFFTIHWRLRVGQDMKHEENQYRLKWMVKQLFSISDTMIGNKQKFWVDKLNKHNP